MASADNAPCATANLNVPARKSQPQAGTTSRRVWLRKCGWWIGGGLAALSVAPCVALRKGRSAESQQSSVKELLEKFASRYEVPGISVAMSCRGKFVLQTAWGWAEREQRVAMTSQHRLRIASISKSITSLTIFRLIEQGQLQLNARPFADPDLLEPFLLQATVDEQSQQRLTEITIQHLLEHTSGGWGNGRQDPMFDQRAIQKNQAELIVWTLQNRLLSREPGKRYEYSNFGYCLLGRVIERVTGKSYEQVVQEQILRPAGTPGICLATEESTTRQDQEVRYYGQQEDPYHPVMRVRRMDAHGGWVATPTELVTLLNRFDSFENPPDLLSRKSLRQMTEPGRINAGYAKGWNVNSAGNWWHLGSFNGGSGVWVRTADGWCWALLVNTRSPQDDYLTELDHLPWSLREALEQT